VIVLSVFRFTDSDYPFEIFKLFFTIREEICTNKDIIFSVTIFIEVAVSNQEISRSVYTC